MTEECQHTTAQECATNHCRLYASPWVCFARYHRATYEFKEYPHRFTLDDRDFVDHHCDTWELSNKTANCPWKERQEEFGYGPVCGVHEHLFPTKEPYTSPFTGETK